MRFLIEESGKGGMKITSADSCGFRHRAFVSRQGDKVADRKACVEFLMRAATEESAVAWRFAAQLAVAAESMRAHAEALAMDAAVHPCHVCKKPVTMATMALDMDDLIMHDDCVGEYEADRADAAYDARDYRKCDAARYADMRGSL